jgi:CxxC motif-containing protein (DUF1111 family)
MKVINHLLAYLAGASLILAPVGLRMLSWLPAETPVDPGMAQAGQVLFLHEWKPNDPLSQGGDGLGPVYNAASCVACHHQGGAGGGGGLEHNVTVFAVPPAHLGDKPREGVVHANAVKYRESLRDLHPDLPDESRPKLEFILTGAPAATKVQLAQRNTPALFGAKLIDEIPDRVLVLIERKQQKRWGKDNVADKPVGRAMRLADGRIGKFGWKAQSASLSDFVQAACANELGLGNPGAAQPRPLGKQDYQPPGLDLSLEQCNQLTAFVAALARPTQRIPVLANSTEARTRIDQGQKLFVKIGCADCHMPSVGSVDGVYSDLLLHHMGESLMTETGSYNGESGHVPRIGHFNSARKSSAAPADEWRTPPLWGVADSAPYLHDGRAATLEDAINMHGGQALPSSRLFSQLQPVHQAQIIDFLKSLRAP